MESLSSKVDAKLCMLRDSCAACCHPERSAGRAEVADTYVDSG